MLITRVSIRNFRCITEINFSAGATTVRIGENNVGKTATLDAIKLALGRRWGRPGNTGFNEYDFRSVLEEGVRTYLPIEIKLDLAESPASQWPQEIKDELVSVINTDPVTGESAITLRVTCKMDEFTKELDPSWEFLNPDGQPFAGAGARNQNLSSFFDYVPFYSMAALRDASSEFSPRSKLWSALLKTIQVDRAKTEELEAKFAQLNDELLAADPKLEGIKTTLRAISQVVATGAAGQVDVRAVPTNLWEILGKAELVVQGHPVDPWLPITRHGNGVQSLAVIFLFRAFVENALAETMRAESEPVLALEEPESHLHPQASRSLWKSISVLPGQKFVTTHSPYFAQNVPFDQIVLLRREGESTTAVAIPRSFEAEIVANDALKAEIEKLGDGISYREDAKRLIGTRQFSNDEFRAMLKCYTAPGSQPSHVKLREFYEEGRRFISSESLAKLESFSRRIRGEIFFARKWLLCEGQSEYAVLTAAAEVLGCPTDSRSVAVIDYQNNGSAGVFATAARALGVRWALICDGDQGGDDHLSQLTTMNFSTGEIGDHTVQLPKGVCLEGLLVKSGVRALMLQAVHDLDPNIPDDDTAIVTFAESHKEEVATRLAARMRASAVPADLPNEVRQVFEKLGEIEANEPAAV